MTSSCTGGRPPGEQGPQWNCRDRTRSGRGSSSSYSNTGLRLTEKVVPPPQRVGLSLLPPGHGSDRGSAGASHPGHGSDGEHWCLTPRPRLRRGAPAPHTWETREDCWLAPAPQELGEDPEPQIRSDLLPNTTKWRSGLTSDLFTTEPAEEREADVSEEPGDPWAAPPVRTRRPGPGSVAAFHLSSL